MIAGFNPNAPWNLVVNCGYYIPVGDGGGDIVINVGDPSGDHVFVHLAFNPGDGVANQVGTVTLQDTTNSDPEGPASFPAGTANTVTITYNGTSLVLRINGTIVCTLPTAVLGAPNDVISLRASTNIVTNALKYANLTLTQ